jgi:transposase InsO family protein
LDDCSRYVVVLQGTWSTRAEPVREQLETAFQECGVPEAMLMDHGTPWWNMKAFTGATWLTLWLMKQGIRLYFSGYQHPQTQGKVERFPQPAKDSIRVLLPICGDFRFIFSCTMWFGWDVFLDTIFADMVTVPTARARFTS